MVSQLGWKAALRLMTCRWDFLELNRSRLVKAKYSAGAQNTRYPKPLFRVAPHVEDVEGDKEYRTIMADSKRVVRNKGAEHCNTSLSSYALSQTATGIPGRLGRGPTHRAAPSGTLGSARGCGSKNAHVSTFNDTR